MTEKKTVAVLGMMCAACAANVERKLNALDGVEFAHVSLPTRTVTVGYDGARVGLEQMKAALDGIGYDMVIEEDRNVEAIERQALSLLRRRVALSWLFALLVMSISMGWISMQRDAANQTCLLLALANLVYCGRQFFTTAWRQLCHASASMDTLVALSTAVSFLFSTYNTFWGEQTWGARGIEWHTYFDASVMIITFVLTGRLMEEHAKQGTASSIRALMGLQPKTAHLVSGEGKVESGEGKVESGERKVESGERTEVTDIPIAAVQKGDVLLVRTGEQIPVDGKVVGGQASPTVDESMMTGEAVPVAKGEGDQLLAGTIVRQGMLHMRAEAVGQKTVLSNMIRMVQEAQASKAPVQRIVDRVALIFVPTVVLLSVLTLVLWATIGGSRLLPQAIVCAVSVLVIACPCAMGLATPTALMVGIGKAAGKSMLIKDATALEQLCRVNAMVVDKTGTITMPSADGDEQLKPHAREAIDELQSEGIEVYMMSGDRPERVAHWAHEAGIRHYQAGVLPSDKEQQVRRLQGEGRCVAMVGDGVNDSQALAAADVSIAMGSGTDVAMSVAQLTLIGSDLRRIPQALRLSRRTVATIRQNLFWAFIYNLVCIPLAAGLPYLFGASWHITPMWASALMAFSSVSVVLNSLRLKLR